jgi:hypothetical protein
MSETIVNKVSESGLVTIDLEEYIPKAEIVTFDLTPHLFRGMILKEKDFREAMQTLDWNQYAQKAVAIICSAEAIIPLWAYMLVSSKLNGIASFNYAGTSEELKKHLFLQNINRINPAEYTDKRVVIKGCGEKAIDAFAYLEITRLLTPIVKSLMYGEPCSTVPVYKKK